MNKNSFLSGLLFLLIAVSIHASSIAEQDDIWFFVLVKSNNYSQDQDGNLNLLNYHFFSEIFSKSHGGIISATLSRKESNEKAFSYEDRGDTFYYEGGHFNTLAAVDAAYPNGRYEFEISLASGKHVKADLSLVGPGGKTDIPDPVQIAFYQEGEKANQRNINPALPLRVTWSPYSNGRADRNGIVDDMIFVVFQSCQGERVFHTGLPFKEADYTKYDVTEISVPANSFKTGQTYALFVEFPHVVDSIVTSGVPGFTSYATATYTDINTTGEAEVNSCPDEIPPLDTGQTDRMDVEIIE